MKRLLTITLFVAFGYTAQAQDLILKKDATEIEAKVMRITDSEIEYKRWSNPDGPTYTLPVDEVFTIQYQNGEKEVISSFNEQPTRQRSKVSPADLGKFPRYQGDFAFAYGVGVSVGSANLFNRIVIETVHGARINPYFFVGAGLAFNYFYTDLVYYDYNDIYELGSGGSVLPLFVNLKGYYPVAKKASIYLSWDLGVALGIGGYFNSGNEFYTSIGPGVSFGPQNGKVNGDFSIRFQHMGTGLNALLFRVGIGF